MINYSKISNKSLLGKLLRFPLKIIPQNATLPILQGPNKGFRWVKGSGVNGYWLGCYEFSKLKLIVSFIKEGMVCYDIGAHVGYYSLVFSKLSGGNGRVFSFEPNPFNLFYLLKHPYINNIKNVNVFPIALYESEGFSPFILNGPMSHLEKMKKKNFVTPTFKLDELVLRNILPPPDIIKFDVEGAELGVLKGMENILRNKSVILFSALDDKGKRQEIF